MPHMEWGLLIVNYLFLGGLSAGLCLVSAIATYLHQRNEHAYGRVARLGALLAPWPVAIGSALLIFDLGNWNRFYILFLRFRWQSPMSIGSWLLLLFNGVAFLNLLAWLSTDELEKLLRRAPFRRRLPFLSRMARGLPARRSLLAAIGFPLSIGVAIYTGVLLGAVQARPFWNTNLVAQIFLFSACSTGCAVLIVILSLSRKAADPAALRFLYLLDIGLITLELFVVLPYILHGQLSALAVRDSLQLILGGPFTWVFWLCFVLIGLFAPLALEVLEVGPVLLRGATPRINPRLAALAGGMVIFGGYVLRYVFVYAGQVSAFR